MRSSAWAYGRIFAWLVPKAPRVLFGVGARDRRRRERSRGSATRRRDPMDYDLKRTENDPYDASGARARLARGQRILGEGHGGDGRPRGHSRGGARAREEAPGRRDAAPPDAKPFVAVHSLWDMVRRRPGGKIPVLLDSASASSGRAPGTTSPTPTGDRVKDCVPPRTSPLRPRRSTASRRAALRREERNAGDARRRRAGASPRRPTTSATSSSTRTPSARRASHRQDRARLRAARSSSRTSSRRSSRDIPKRGGALARAHDRSP